MSRALVCLTFLVVACKSGGDDGAGPALVARLRRRAPRGADLALSDGEILGLLAALDGRERVILVDAARSGRPPGSIVRVSEPGTGATTLRAGSTHAFGNPGAIEARRATPRCSACASCRPITSCTRAPNATASCWRTRRPVSASASVWRSSTR